MKGRIIKGIAGFYYVDVPGSGLYECKAKGVFRNRGMKPLVGDYAEISVIDEENKKGNVDEIYPQIIAETVTGCNLLEVDKTC